MVEASETFHSMPYPRWVLFRDIDPDVLEEERVKYIKWRDEMLALQKEFSKDRELAKFFKEESRYWLKHYRAVCLLIPWYAGEYPKDCEWMPPNKWPEELYPMIFHIGLWASIQVKKKDRDEWWLKCPSREQLM